MLLQDLQFSIGWFYKSAIFIIIIELRVRLLVAVLFSPALKSLYLKKEERVDSKTDVDVGADESRS